MLVKGLPGIPGWIISMQRYWDIGKRHISGLLYFISLSTPTLSIYWVFNVFWQCLHLPTFLCCISMPVSYDLRTGIVAMDLHTVEWTFLADDKPQDCFIFNNLFFLWSRGLTTCKLYVCKNETKDGNSLGEEIRVGSKNGTPLTISFTVLYHVDGPTLCWFDVILSTRKEDPKEWISPMHILRCVKWHHT